MGEGLARWWGCCAINRLGDKAGNYRRIAAGLAAISAPLIIVAAAAVARDGRASTSTGLGHLVVGIGCAWLAFDLFRHASALRANGLPHTSSVALLGGIVLFVVLARAEPAIGFGPPVLLVVGLAVLVGGYIMLLTAERGQDRFLAIAGRWAIVGGLVLVGAMELGRTIAVFPSAPIEACGFGLVAVLLMATGWCEARVLLRGAALYRTLAQR